MQNQGNKTNGFAIAGLVLGIVSIVLCWISFVGLVAGIVGLILSVMGRKHCAPEQTGMVTAGLVLSIIGIVFSGIWTICAMCTICAVNETTSNIINSQYYY